VFEADAAGGRNGCRERDCKNGVLHGLSTRQAYASRN
jgi:hypothetical protein